MSEIGGDAGQAGSPSTTALEDIAREAIEREANAKSTQAHEISIAIRNGLRLGGSLILTWAVALIVKLQIPAQLGPIRQGHFAFAESFAMIFFSVISLGIDTYIVKEVPVRPAHASDFMGGVFALRTLLSLVLLVAMMGTLSLTGRSEEVQLTALVFGLGQFLMSMNGALASVLQAVTHVGRLALANIAAKFIWGAGLLLGLHFHAPMWVLALPMVIAELLRTAVLVPTATSAAALRYRIDVLAAKAALVASVPYFLNNVAVTFGNYLALSALEFIREDKREVGWFAASQNLASLAMLLHPLLVWVVMPMLSRAQARSNEEMTAILRRAIEGLLVVIAPCTVFISAGSDVLIDVAFGAEYAPASYGLSILSLVFLMTYMNIMLASALILADRSWSVTVISIASVVLLAGFMLVFVPLGLRLLGEGGECAGAAVAVIASEACVVVAMLTRFPISPLDGRNWAVLLKSVGISAVVLILNDYLADMGAPRLIIVMALYLLLAWVVRVVQPAEVVRVIQLLRARRAAPPPPS